MTSKRRLLPLLVALLIWGNVNSLSATTKPTTTTEPPSNSSRARSSSSSETLSEPLPPKPLASPPWIRNSTRTPIRRVVIDEPGARTRVVGAEPREHSRLREPPGSPVAYFRPESYGFFAVNDDGQLVRKQMTKQEIQSMIATGGGGGAGGSLPVDLGYHQAQLPNGDPKIEDIVDNVQKVMKGELNKPVPVYSAGSSIPDSVNSEWTNLLPSLLSGGSGVPQDIALSPPVDPVHYYTDVGPAHGGKPAQGQYVPGTNYVQAQPIDNQPHIVYVKPTKVNGENPLLLGNMALEDIYLGQPEIYTPPKGRPSKPPTSSTYQKISTKPTYTVYPNSGVNLKNSSIDKPTLYIPMSASPSYVTKPQNNIYGGPGIQVLPGYVSKPNQQQKNITKLSDSGSKTSTTNVPSKKTTVYVYPNEAGYTRVPMSPMPIISPDKISAPNQQTFEVLPTIYPGSTKLTTVKDGSYPSKVNVGPMGGFKNPGPGSRPSTPYRPVYEPINRPSTVSYVPASSYRPVYEATANPSTASVASSSSYQPVYQAGSSSITSKPKPTSSQQSIYETSKKPSGGSKVTQKPGSTYSTRQSSSPAFESTTRSSLQGGKIKVTQQPGTYQTYSTQKDQPYLSEDANKPNTEDEKTKVSDYSDITESPEAFTTKKESVPESDDATKSSDQIEEVKETAYPNYINHLDSSPSSDELSKPSYQSEKETTQYPDDTYQTYINEKSPSPIPGDITNPNYPGEKEEVTQYPINYITTKNTYPASEDETKSSTQSAEAQVPEYPNNNQLYNIEQNSYPLTAVTTKPSTQDEEENNTHETIKKDSAPVTDKETKPSSDTDETNVTQDPDKLHENYAPDQYLYPEDENKPSTTQTTQYPDSTNVRQTTKKPSSPVPQKVIKPSSNTDETTQDSDKSHQNYVPDQYLYSEDQNKPSPTQTTQYLDTTYKRYSTKKPSSSEPQKVAKPSSTTDETKVIQDPDKSNQDYTSDQYLYPEDQNKPSTTQTTQYLDTTYKRYSTKKPSSSVPQKVAKPSSNTDETKVTQDPDKSHEDYAPDQYSLHPEDQNKPSTTQTTQYPDTTYKRYTTKKPSSPRPQKVTKPSSNADETKLTQNPDKSYQDYAPGQYYYSEDENKPSTTQTTQYPDTTYKRYTTKKPSSPRPQKVTKPSSNADEMKLTQDPDKSHQDYVPGQYFYSQDENKPSTTQTTHSDTGYKRYTTKKPSSPGSQKVTKPSSNTDGTKVTQVPDKSHQDYASNQYLLHPEDQNKPSTTQTTQYPDTTYKRYTTKKPSTLRPQKVTKPSSNADETKLTQDPDKSYQDYAPGQYFYSEDENKPSTTQITQYPDTTYKRYTTKKPSSPVPQKVTKPSIQSDGYKVTRHPSITVPDNKYESTKKHPSSISQGVTKPSTQNEGKKTTAYPGDKYQTTKKYSYPVTEDVSNPSKQNEEKVTEYPDNMYETTKKHSSPVSQGVTKPSKQSEEEKTTEYPDNKYEFTKKYSEDVTKPSKQNGEENITQYSDKYETTKKYSSPVFEDVTKPSKESEEENITKYPDNKYESTKKYSYPLPEYVGEPSEQSEEEKVTKYPGTYETTKKYSPLVSQGVTEPSKQSEEENITKYPNVKYETTGKDAFPVYQDMTKPSEQNKEDGVTEYPNNKYETTKKYTSPVYEDVTKPNKQSEEQQVTKYPGNKYETTKKNSYPVLQKVIKPSKESEKEKVTEYPDQYETTDNYSTPVTEDVFKPSKQNEEKNVSEYPDKLQNTKKHSSPESGDLNKPSEQSDEIKEAEYPDKFEPIKKDSSVESDDVNKSSEQIAGEKENEYPGNKYEPTKKYSSSVSDDVNKPSEQNEEVKEPEYPGDKYQTTKKYSFPVSEDVAKPIKPSEEEVTEYPKYGTTKKYSFPVSEEEAEPSVQGDEDQVTSYLYNTYETDSTPKSEYVIKPSNQKENVKVTHYPNKYGYPVTETKSSAQPDEVNTTSNPDETHQTYTTEDNSYPEINVSQYPDKTEETNTTPNLANTYQSYTIDKYLSPEYEIQPNSETGGHTVTQHPWTTYEKYSTKRPLPSVPQKVTKPSIPVYNTKKDSSSVHEVVTVPSTQSQSKTTKYPSSTYPKRTSEYDSTPVIKVITRPGTPIGGSKIPDLPSLFYPSYTPDEDSYSLFGFKKEPSFQNNGQNAPQYPSIVYQTNSFNQEPSFQNNGQNVPQYPSVIYQTNAVEKDASPITKYVTKPNTQTGGFKGTQYPGINDQTYTIKKGTSSRLELVTKPSIPSGGLKTTKLPINTYQTQTTDKDSSPVIENVTKPSAQSGVLKGTKRPSDSKKTTVINNKQSNKQGVSSNNYEKRPSPGSAQTNKNEQPTYTDNQDQTTATQLDVTSQLPENNNDKSESIDNIYYTTTPDKIEEDKTPAIGYYITDEPSQELVEPNQQQPEGTEGYSVYKDSPLYSSETIQPTGSNAENNDYYTPIPQDTTKQPEIVYKSTESNPNEKTDTNIQNYELNSKKPSDDSQSKDQDTYNKSEGINKDNYSVQYIPNTYKQSDKKHTEYVNEPEQTQPSTTTKTTEFIPLDDGNSDDYTTTYDPDQSKPIKKKPITSIYEEPVVIKDSNVESYKKPSNKDTSTSTTNETPEKENNKVTTGTPGYSVENNKIDSKQPVYENKDATKEPDYQTTQSVNEYEIKPIKDKKPAIEYPSSDDQNINSDGKVDETKTSYESSDSVTDYTNVKPIQTKESQKDNNEPSSSSNKNKEPVDNYQTQIVTENTIKPTVQYSSKNTYTTPNYEKVETITKNIPSTEAEPELNQNNDKRKESVSPSDTKIDYEKNNEPQQEEISTVTVIPIYDYDYTSYIPQSDNSNTSPETQLNKNSSEEDKPEYSTGTQKPSKVTKQPNPSSSKESQTVQNSNNPEYVPVHQNNDYASSDFSQTSTPLIRITSSSPSYTEQSSTDTVLPGLDEALNTYMKEHYGSKLSTPDSNDEISRLTTSTLPLTNSDYLTTETPKQSINKQKPQAKPDLTTAKPKGTKPLNDLPSTPVYGSESNAYSTKNPGTNNKNDAGAHIIYLDVVNPQPDKQTVSQPLNKHHMTNSSFTRIETKSPAAAVDKIISQAPAHTYTPSTVQYTLPSNNKAPNNIASGLIAGYPTPGERKPTATQAPSTTSQKINDGTNRPSISKRPVQLKPNENKEKVTQKDDNVSYQRKPTTPIPSSSTKYVNKISSSPTTYIPGEDGKISIQNYPTNGGPSYGSHTKIPFERLPAADKSKIPSQPEQTDDQISPPSVNFSDLINQLQNSPSKPIGNDYSNGIRTTMIPLKEFQTIMGESNFTPSDDTLTTVIDNLRKTPTESQNNTFVVIQTLPYSIPYEGSTGPIINQASTKQPTTGGKITPSGTKSKPSSHPTTVLTVVKQPVTGKPYVTSKYSTTKGSLEKIKSTIDIAAGRINLEEEKNKTQQIKPTEPPKYTTKSKYTTVRRPTSDSYQGYTKKTTKPIDKGTTVTNYSNSKPSGNTASYTRTTPKPITKGTTISDNANNKPTGDKTVYTRRPTKPINKVTTVADYATGKPTVNTKDSSPDKWMIIPQKDIVDQTGENKKPPPQNDKEGVQQLHSQIVPLDHSTGAIGLDQSTKDLDADVAKFMDLCNELSFRFWTLANSELNPSRSVTMSPFGIISTLAMIFLGARGLTSNQMNDVMKLDEVVEFNPHLVFQNITDMITLSRGHGIESAAFGKILFADRRKVRKIIPFYKEQAQQFYDGAVVDLNFPSAGDLANRRTNLLIRKQTGGKVKDFVRMHSVQLRSPLTALSANVFQTSCDGPDASSEGRDGEMYFAVSQAIKQRKLMPIPAIVIKRGVRAGYEPSLDATAVAITDPDRPVALIMVMPGQQGVTAPGDNLDKLQQRLFGKPNDKAWEKLLKVIVSRPVEVQIPKFSHRSVINMTSALKQMGFDQLFSKSADLKGINGAGHDLYLADMIQMNLFCTCGDDNKSGGRHLVETYPGAPSRHSRVWRFTNVNNSNDVYDNLEVMEPQRSGPSETSDCDDDNFSGSWTDFQSLPNVKKDFKGLNEQHSESENWDSRGAHSRCRNRRQRDVENARPRMKMDKPFMYMIRHTRSGMVTHIGRFNPRNQS